MDPQYSLQIITCMLLSLSAISSSTSTKCDRSCGKHRLPYPFGFSHHCGIKLNCSREGGITVADFPVLNVTSDQILISVPASCDRPITKLRKLFNQDYFAPSSRNVFLFENCTSAPSDCQVPERYLGSKFNETCLSRERHSHSHSYNISCYSRDFDGRADVILDGKKVNDELKCSVFVSSFAVESSSSSVSLEYQTMGLRWWYNQTSCHSNASRTKIEMEGKQQIRNGCRCNEGFVGDGFARGEGCKRVTNCSAPRYLPVRCGEVSLAILVGGVIGCTAVVAGVTCLCMKRRSKSVKIGLSTKHLLSEAAGSSNIPFYTCKEIERATDCFAEKQRLGTGAYGTVYEGKLHGGLRVAIKRLRHQDHQSAEQVMNEIKLLSSVSHPNSVRLLGCCIEQGQQILIYEFMPNGTLAQHLQRARGAVLPWTIRLDIAAETAQAIAHLHTAMNPPIYHRDVKSSNILLDYDFKSKVADFGLSRYGMADNSHVSTAPQGTPGYVDPQYHQNFHLSDKSDVYSFGVVLVEIITALKVVDFSRPQSEINLAELAVNRIRDGCIDDIIDPLIEPNRDAWTLWSVHRVAELAFRCLSFHREMRPSMMEVADELEQIRISGWAPWEDNAYMGSPAASSCSSMSTSTAKKVQHQTPDVEDSWSPPY